MLFLDLYSALMYKQKARIHTIEPNPLLAKGLAQRFARKPGICVHPVALGARPAVMTLYLPRYRGYRFYGLGSLDRREASEWLRPRLYGYDDRYLELEQFTVQVTTLDLLAAEHAIRPSIVKLDVQGFEAQAIEGGIEVLRRDEPILIIESGGPGSAVDRLLRPLGYLPFVWHGNHFESGYAPLANTWYVSERRAGSLGLAASLFQS
jgi:FkbM family methyltransferase